jgi:hypothetical protein
MFLILAILLYLLGYILFVSLSISVEDPIGHRVLEIFLISLFWPIIIFFLISTMILKQLLNLLLKIY